MTASPFAVGADNTAYYDPQKMFSNIGFVTSVDYAKSLAQEDYRNKALAAEQLAQAGATTSGLNSQANMAKTAAGNLASLSSSLGSLSAPNLTSGGIYSLPGMMGGSYGGGYYTGGTGSGIPNGANVQAQYDPWSVYRPDAAAQLASQMGQADPSQIYQDKLAQMANGTFTPDDPSYAWRFQQGQQATARSLAARGLLNSGNAAIELQNYGQNAASQEYQAQWQRMLSGLSGTEDAYNTQMGRLMTMAGVNIDPTAGGQLAVAQQNANTNAVNAGTNAAQVAGNYDLGMRDLLLKQYLGSLSAATGSVGGMSGTNWSAVFNT